MAGGNGGQVIVTGPVRGGAPERVGGRSSRVLLPELLLGGKQKKKAQD